MNNSVSIIWFYLRRKESRIKRETEDNIVRFINTYFPNVYIYTSFLLFSFLSTELPVSVHWIYNRDNTLCLLQVPAYL